MRAADTNVLVRLVTGDDARQTEVAEAFVAGGAWVSSLALAEAVWVLRRTYKFDATKLAGTIELLLGQKGLVLEDEDAIAAALGLFRARPGLGFSDCLTLELARKAGHLPLGTFDRALGKADGAHQL
jgi:predicted nucleic-acid-binding protein